MWNFNVASDLRIATMAEHPEKFDPGEYLKPARAGMKELVRHKLRTVLGCSGKAFD